MAGTTSIRYRVRLRAFLALLALLGVARVGAAEWEGNVYLGEGPTSVEDNVERFGDVVVRDYRPKDTADVIGLRFTQWFPERHWFGLAADISVFDPMFDEVPPGQSHNGPSIVSFSALAMFRIRFLESVRFPVGRLEAYSGVGPALFWTHFNSRVRRPDGSIAYADDSSTDLGTDIRIGARARIDQTYGVFLEYRRAEYDTTLTGDGIRYSPTFKSEHLSLGLSFRFGHSGSE